VSGLYVDTSALGRVLLGESDAEAITATIDRYDEQWSSEMLTVELGRLAKLHSLESDADEMLEDIRLLRVTSARLRSAKEIDPAQVRTLDSIHLSAAVSLHRLGTIAAVLTFDGQLQDGCRHHGITVEAPAP
jgi:predicted nucleic acid-binding protein